ncbi:unnamed protein product [Microthlaspi erraticum]|uniref:non-specific serine/threonine protein kinase n=1 Tax=Microthlaspi erraticum TaxID=1685480 RepID=A0A6D2KCL0_9BRAS|nr:unnamed protein product [Microthlaspi erraticum]
MIQPNGVLRLTDQSSNVLGTAFYNKPVRLLDHSNLSTNATVLSFSTSFVFGILFTSSRNGGYGLTFTLSPTPNRPGAESGRYLGLVNEQNNGNSSNHVFAVEFDTVQGSRDDNSSGISNHIGLNFNGVTSFVEEPVLYEDGDNRREEVHIRVRLDYDGPTQTLNMIATPWRFQNDPGQPTISQRIPKLSEIVQEEMYVGFTASTGRDQSSGHYIMAWSFTTGRENLSVPFRDIPLLVLTKGHLPDGRKVAVKVLKESTSNGEDFINEVASMSQTSHVNIVSLVGFCFEGSKRVIVYEFLENGSLDQFISANASSSAEWRMRLYEIALGVARGLEYLHYGCKTRIVHFDIKPQNVLLDCNLCPKVSDFGLAKLCKKKESTMSMLDTRGTIGYIAPEMISRVYGSVSHKSDVYSYGMLVLEMIGATNKDRVGNVASNTSSVYFPDWICKCNAPPPSQ